MSGVIHTSANLNATTLEHLGWREVPSHSDSLDPMKNTRRFERMDDNPHAWIELASDCSSLYIAHQLGLCTGSLIEMGINYETKP